jgi:hypothetical protein
MLPADLRSATLLNKLRREIRRRLAKLQEQGKRKAPSGSAIRDVVEQALESNPTEQEAHL